MSSQNTIMAATQITKHNYLCSSNRGVAEVHTLPFAPLHIGAKLIHILSSEHIPTYKENNCNKTQLSVSLFRREDRYSG